MSETRTLSLFRAKIGDARTLLVAAEDEPEARRLATSWREAGGMAPSSFVRISPVFGSLPVIVENVARESS